MDKISASKHSWTMAQVKGKHTGPEKIVRSLLHRLGYRFRLHRKDLPGNLDIVLPKFKIEKLISRYNEIVRSVETDLSLMINL